MREIELKLLLDARQERLLRSGAAVGRLAAGPARTRELHSTYFDTADGALQRAGIALRLRLDGRRRVQTVKKARGAIAQGFSMPTEDECELPGGALDLSRIADPALRDEVVRFSAPGIAPVAETVIRRTTRPLRGPGGATVELAIDIGQVRAGGRAAPLAEAELELKEGPAEDVFALARALITLGPVRFSNRTKSERAGALRVNCPAVEPALPMPPRRVTVAPGATVEEAAIALLSELQHRIATNIVAAVETDAAEAPHQLGLALCHLRDALARFRPALGCAGLDRLDAEARDIAALIEGQAERTGLRRALAGLDAAAFVIDLAGFVALRGWRAGGADPAALQAPARALPGLGSLCCPSGTAG